MLAGLPEKPLTAYSFEEMGFVFVGKDPIQVAVRILDRTSVIDYFGGAKPQLACGCFLHGDCAAVGVLLSIGQVVRYVYTYWLDYQKDFDRNVLDALQNQSFLTARFYGSNLQQSRLYLVENPMQSLLKQVTTTMEKLPPWSPDQFRQVQFEVNRRYGRGDRLWRRLADGNKVIQLDP